MLPEVIGPAATEGSAEPKPSVPKPPLEPSAPSAPPGAPPGR